ncbi:MAG: hypothetical protein ACRD4E_06360, partial [Bryobacteraceae bacterium]
IHAMAEMLRPVRGAVRKAKTPNPCLQPFRFVALADQDHHNLSMALDSALDGNALESGPVQGGGSSGFY